MNEPERVSAKQRCANIRFVDLPLEIVVHILSGLRIRDCSRFARTCKPMNQPFNDGEFWKIKTTADWVEYLRGMSLGLFSYSFVAHSQAFRSSRTGLFSIAC